MTKDNLYRICLALTPTARPQVTVSFGNCSPVTVADTCRAAAVNPDIRVLYWHAGDGHACYYSRATGSLLGQTVDTDTPSYCGGRTFVAGTSGLNSPWCYVDGTDSFSVSCADLGDGGVDGRASDA
jgi:hypothetical protein